MTPAVPLCFRIYLISARAELAGTDIGIYLGHMDDGWAAPDGRKLGRELVSAQSSLTCHSAVSQGAWQY